MAPPDLETGSASEVALEFAVRRWQAEEENARRLGSRTSGLLALATGMFGLGLAKIGSLQTFEPQWLNTLVKGTLALGVLSAGASLFRLLSVKKRSKSKPLASVELYWPDQFDPPFDALWADEAREIAYVRTTKATLQLQQANVKKQGSVDDGQVLLLIALLAAGIALLCYLFSGNTSPSADTIYMFQSGSIADPAK